MKTLLQQSEFVHARGNNKGEQNKMGWKKTSENNKRKEENQKEKSQNKDGDHNKDRRFQTRCIQARVKL